MFHWGKRNSDKANEEEEEEVEEEGTEERSLLGTFISGLLLLLRLLLLWRSGGGLEERPAAAKDSTEETECFRHHDTRAVQVQCTAMVANVRISRQEVALSTGVQVAEKKKHDGDFEFR